MFGYVKPFKPELKICEFEAYKAVYCGLCGQLGRNFGTAARLTLSYDFAFLSMLHLSLSQDDPGIERRRCYVNPLKKTPCAGESEALRFGADIAAIMLYYKLLDNIADSGYIGKSGWSLLRPLAASARKKAASSRSEAEEIISISVERQAEVEIRACSGLDEASDPTASAMSRICAMLSTDEKSRRVLARFGYCLGRFSYICDALDDFGQDLAKGGYNPLVLKFGNDPDSAGEFAKASLYMTIGEAAKAYDLLSPRAFRPVLDNIVYLGMRASVDDILLKKRKEKCK